MIVVVDFLVFAVCVLLFVIFACVSCMTFFLRSLFVFVVRLLLVFWCSSVCCCVLAVVCWMLLVLCLFTLRSK